MNADSIREKTVYAIGENYRHWRKTANDLRSHARRLIADGKRRDAQIKLDSARCYATTTQTSLEKLVNMRRALLSAAHELSAHFRSIVPSAEARAKLAYFEARIGQVDDYLGGGR